MKLYFRKAGETGQAIIILHGIFGSSDNWLTIGKVLADTYQVYMVDQRNHGQSPKSDEFNYEVMSADLKEFIDDHQIENPVIIGHSMGGKTVMQFALNYPDSFSKMMVVDIAPKFYPVHHHMILQGLAAVDLPNLSSRTEANEILKRFEEKEGVRQFLIKNLWRNPEKDNQFDWRINVPVISKNIDVVGHELDNEHVVDQPVLFVRGSESHYIQPEDERRIWEIFPNYELVTVEGAGHWVQADNPQEFIRITREFVQ
ncbi:alpha/beta fold hydrolase [Flectobacillus roseus]|uniref:Alpha/beta fold hydrolase n=1 Tax=Flectobacillus roseus TaxID=502259 RepID=A0ABT6Y695_9BACT|nr:alpha/beta fold hydrolase [Flectobacillus roseus]MDI9859098.1 alpha/beta fold hydrolase [Flectobacillus roseus]